MKNVPHLEDLVWSLSVEELQEILTALVFCVGGHDTGKLQIKYDGIFIAVGKDERGFFVAGKGFLNKNPIKFYSIEELTQPDASAKYEKLAAVFNVFRSNRYKMMRGAVFTGDLMWYNKSFKKGFQPNIINYQFNWLPYDDYELGIAWHNDYIQLKDSVCTLPNYVYAKMPNFEKLLRQVNLQKAIYEADQHFSKKDIALIKKAYNQEIRSGEKWEWPKEVSYSYSHIIRHRNVIKLKKEILQYLHSLEPHFTCSINDKPTTHEGFIFRYKDHVIKLVDREVFSRANFNQETSRGWALS